MSLYRVRAPVAMIVFNRSESTARVFEEVRKAQPTKLLLVADGPRADRTGEKERCRDTRAIFDQVDWECEVITNFSETNLGCRDRVSSGVRWIFEQVEEAIILEDDCLPDPSFFQFCDELLEKYRDDTRVAQICGANNQLGIRRGTESYFFSRYNNIWGWASWRRAVQHYDVTMKEWPRFLESGRLHEVLGRPSEIKYWRGIFQKTFDEKINTWDYQWVFSSWTQNMLSIVPNKNLITNIGIGPEATHGMADNPFVNAPREKVIFPLQHPQGVQRCIEADRHTDALEYGGTIRSRFRNKVRGALKRLKIDSDPALNLSFIVLMTLWILQRLLVLRGRV